MAEGALDEKMLDDNIMMCDNSIEAGRELVKMISPGDVIYIKGSQGMRMERAIEMILDATHNPRAVLVRQEDAWIKKR
jgi:UDP-N-acetylmuramyl pentapeptide synthase